MAIRSRAEKRRGHWYPTPLWKGENSMMEWIRERKKTKRIAEIHARKRRDWHRPYRIAQRIKLRIEACRDTQDVERARVLLARMRRVLDFQLKNQ